MKPIPYGRQSIEDEDVEAVVRALRSDFLTQGPAVEQFERSVASAVGAKHAVAVANGTAALHLNALALGVGPGKTAIVPPITFAASANCVRYCGGDVEFCDVDPETGCLDFDSVAQILERRPEIAGVVAVDLAGLPVRLDRLRKLIGPHRWIIEDACHALGGAYVDDSGKRRPCGGDDSADAAIFSFHPVKHVATGEGGMVTTARADVAAAVRESRAHGVVRDPARLERNDGGWYYEMQSLGFNYRMPDLLCALGTSQMSRLRQNLARRREIARIYSQELKGVGDLRLPSWDGFEHAFHLYVVQTDRRDSLYAFLRERGIFTQVHYVPIYRFPYYRRLYGEISRPNAEIYYRRCLSLPMFHGLLESEQSYVVESLRAFFS